MVKAVVDIDGEIRTLLVFKKDFGKNMSTEIKSFDLGDEEQLDKELNEKFEGTKCHLKFYKKIILDDTDTSEDFSLTHSLRLCK